MRNPPQPPNWPASTGASASLTAEAVQATLKKHPIKLDLIGCHGQTLYHQARPAAYAGRTFSCTWQLGEPAAIASATGVPVVSNFRPADMFAGGQGAPLVSLLDYVLFADNKRGRILQNIGGIANLTAIPARATPAAVIAFDTGPGNMIIDALTQTLFNKPFDRNGAAGRPWPRARARTEGRPAPSFFPSPASPHRGPRTVRPRVRRRIPRQLPKDQPHARRRNRHSHRAHRRIHRAKL